MGRWQSLCNLCCCRVDEDRGHKLAADGVMQPGAGVLHVDLGSQGIMRVFYYLPEQDRFDPERTPVHFVIHGMHRDAHHLFDAVLDVGEVQRLGIILLVPAISNDLFPQRRGFNFGNVFAKDVAKWMEKGHGNLPPINDPSHWSFTAIETVFDAVRAGCGSRAPTYTIFGHSAGAQFVHRFALMFGTDARDGAVEGEQLAFRASTMVCANAGWWTMPNFRGCKCREEAVFPFPYGLDALHESPQKRDEVAATFLKMNLLVFLGEQDTDPRIPNPKTWEDCPAAAAQGPHRLARGECFFQAGRDVSQELGVPCNWSKQLVPGVGHDGARMALVAIRFLFDPEKRGVVDTTVLKDYHGKTVY